MTELREKLNNIVEDYNECTVLAKSVGSSEVYEGTTATAEDIIEGKTAYSNGKKIIGTAKANNNNVKINTELKTSTTFNKEEFWKILEVVDFTNIDVSKYTSFRSGFEYCYGLKEIKGLNLANIGNCYLLFNNCKKLEKLEILNLAPTNGREMFQACVSLTEIPPMDTSKLTAAWSMFNGCSLITTLPEYDFGKVQHSINVVSGCTSLQNVGGFKDLGKNYSQANKSYQDLSLNNCTLLTHESLMNIINGLYDLNLTYDVANGGTLVPQNLTLGATNLAKLTAEEIEIATNKRLECVIRRGEI